MSRQIAIKSNYGASLAIILILCRWGTLTSWASPRWGCGITGNTTAAPATSSTGTCPLQWCSQVSSSESRGHKYVGKFANFPAAGCPSVPVIKGETAGDQAYSYEVVWSVESDYSLLQHEVASLIDHTPLSNYWPGCLLAPVIRPWHLPPGHSPHQAGPRSHGHQVRSESLDQTQWKCSRWNIETSSSFEV